MGSLVNARSLCLASLLLMLLPAQASAAGRLLARGGTGIQLEMARSALARGPARATVWHQLRVDGSAEELLWLLPVPPGVGVDVAASSFFDGLEEATAPRVLAPSGTAPKNQTCSNPSPEVISLGEGGPTLALLGQEVFSDPASIQPKLDQLGYTLSAAELAELNATVNNGARLLALRLAAPLGPSSTITVRLHGTNANLGATTLLRSSSESLPWVLWMVGASRGKAQGVGELEMEPSAVRWLSPTTSNYTALQNSMLEKANNASVLLQVAGPGPLRDLTALPGGNDIPPFLDAYLRRVFERGEASGDLGGFSDGAHLATDGDLPDGCPRGDLLPFEGFTCTPPGAQDPVVPSPGADDLAFVFAGNAPLRWVSRAAGRVPAKTAAPAVSVAFPGGDPVSLLITPASVWDGLCSTVGVGGQGNGGGTGFGGTNNGTGAGGPVPVGAGGTGSSEGNGYDDGSSSSGCSCTNVFIGESCNGSSQDSDPDSSGCNCNDTSSSEDDSSSDGCSCGDSSSSSGDSCSGSDSSGDSGDSCSGSEGSGGGDSCGSGTSGGDSCGKDCSVGRGRRRSPRLSKWLLLIAAAALPLRRWTRPRDRKQRKDRVTG